MTAYPKINSLFKRDMATGRLILGSWSQPEFEYLQDAPWTWTEKVDGTNVRLRIRDGAIDILGRTDKSTLPAPLIEAIHTLLPDERFVGGSLIGATLYGEGYGWKIQAAGPHYSAEPRFILFDVRIGEYWLDRNDVDEIAKSLGIKSVPVVGVGTLDQAIYISMDPPRSCVAEADTTFLMEGTVVRPLVRLLDASARRIIGKIKASDYAPCS